MTVRYQVTGPLRDPTTVNKQLTSARGQVTTGWLSGCRYFGPTFCNIIVVTLGIFHSFMSFKSSLTKHAVLRKLFVYCQVSTGKLYEFGLSLFRPNIVKLDFWVDYSVHKRLVNSQTKHEALPRLQSLVFDQQGKATVHMGNIYGFVWKLTNSVERLIKIVCGLSGCCVSSVHPVVCLSSVFILFYDRKLSNIPTEATVINFSQPASPASWAHLPALLRR